MRDYSSISDMFKPSSIWTMLVLAVLSSIITICLSYKFLQALQQKGYVCSDYFKWISKKNNVFNSRVIMLSLLSTFAFCLYNAVFAFIDNDFFTLSGFVFYLFFDWLSFDGHFALHAEQLPQQPPFFFSRLKLSTTPATEPRTINERITTSIADIRQPPFFILCFMLFISDIQRHNDSDKCYCKNNTYPPVCKAPVRKT